MLCLSGDYITDNKWFQAKCVAQQNWENKKNYSSYHLSINEP